MFGSRWSRSAAMANCSSATSHGSRWVWSMTAALAFMNTSDASCTSRLQFFDHEPIIGRLTRLVRAVPILEHDAPEALRLKCVAPRPQAARDEGCQSHIGARRQNAFEMTSALEERDGKEGLAVDLE